MGLDSLATTELALEIEHEYGITISEEVAKAFRTLGDVVSTVDAIVGGRQP